MKNNKFLTFLFALVMAFCAWVYVITAITPDYKTTISEIPVSLEGEILLEERNLILTTQELPKVTLKLYGNRSDLNKLNNENITLKVDLSKVYEAGEYSLPFTPAYPGNIAGSEIQIQERLPSRIKLTVENLERKEVPVVLNYIGTVADGYVCEKDTAVLEHETVMLSGPESVLDKITQARVDVVLTNRTESFSESYRYTLCDEDGNPVEARLVTTNVPEVDFTMMVRKLKTIPLAVNVIDGGGATEATSQILIEPLSIQVSGSEAALAELESLVIGTINLDKVIGENNYTMDIILPPGIKCVSGETQAKVNVSFPALQTRRFEVQDVELLNIAENLTGELKTRTVTVVIRGPRELVEKLTPEDIRVQVDLQGEKAGLISKTITLILPEEFRELGPWDPPAVTVELTEVQEVLSDDPTGANTKMLR